MKLTNFLTFRLSLSSQFQKTWPTMKSFVFWFSSEYTGFQLPELEALFKLFNINHDILAQHRSVGPFIVLDFPNDQYPKKIMSRSILAHACYELWSEGASLNELHLKLKENVHLFEPYNMPASPCSFRFRVDAFGKNISQAEKLNFIETFDYIPLTGKVDLVNPDLSLHLLQYYYGLDPNKAPENPSHVFLGRWIADGQRRLAFKLSLKTRKFIGNTSMDAMLSIIMANLAVVDKDDVVCDPFVGTGSLLVAAAQMGAMVCGGDIDYLMLHARTRPTRAKQKIREEDESVRSNFKQYGIESKYLDVVVTDSSRPLWRPDFKFDAIITDPPYGIREPTQKVGTEKNKDFKIKEEHLALHVPSKLDYSLGEIYKDLIKFASKHLNLHGRLVCWIPVSRADYEPDKLPRNPCFRLIANCEQLLTVWAARRLLVYEKIAEPNASSETIMDSTALMYRVKFFESGGIKCRKGKKWISNSQFGDGAKRGQMRP